MAAPSDTVVPPRGAKRNALCVAIDVPLARHAAAVWALESLMVRAKVQSWQLAAAEDEPDLTIPGDPAQWEFTATSAPDAARDPLAAAFWWLARVEEQLAPEASFDEHGRFRYAGSALERGGDPLATPVEDIARSLGVAGWADLPERGWCVVPTHDIDLPWRWGLRGRRRTMRAIRHELRGGHLVRAKLLLLALLAAPVWRLRRGDPWNNADRIRRVEWRTDARSTSYLLVDAHVPADGDPDVLERGARRYADRLVAWTRRRRTSGGGLAGVHGSYTTSDHPERLARERQIVEGWVGDEVTDHRFHYLRHRPVDAWPMLAAAGFRSESSLGFAEQVGFRAGTAHPFRAWDHEADRPLDLVIVPLAFMDATLDARYLDLSPRAAGRDLADAVIDRIREVGGCASILFHNDRLCTVDTWSWTRLYERMLRRVRAGNGRAITARDAATEYRAALPTWRLDGTSR